MGTVTAKIFLPFSVSFSTNSVFVFMAISSSLSHFPPISLRSLAAMVTQSVLLGGIVDNSNPRISGCAASVSSTSFCANILGDTFFLLRALNGKTQSTAPQLNKTTGVQLRIERDACFFFLIDVFPEFASHFNSNLDQHLWL